MRHLSDRLSFAESHQAVADFSNEARTKKHRTPDISAPCRDSAVELLFSRVIATTKAKTSVVGFAVVSQARSNRFVIYNSPSKNKHDAIHFRGKTRQ
jgi:hypothetical protein